MGLINIVLDGIKRIDLLTSLTINAGSLIAPVAYMFVAVIAPVECKLAAVIAPLVIDAAVIPPLAVIKPAIPIVEDAYMFVAVIPPFAVILPVEIIPVTPIINFGVSIRSA